VPGNAPLNGIVRAPDGVFWLGASDGLLRWDGSAAWQKFTTANSAVPDNYIRRVACDRAGAIWIATASESEKAVGGLGRLYQGKWTVYDPGNSPLPECRVWDVFPDSRGRVWAATSHGAACLLPDGSWRVYDMLHSGLSDDMVTAITEDRDGNLWFATAYGVSRFTPPIMPAR
jgi:ligand-binding sensor domain-containing protein